MNIQNQFKNSRRSAYVVNTQNPMILRCFYPVKDKEGDSFQEPVCQFNFNGNKRSPMFTVIDATYILNVAKGVRSRFNADNRNTGTCETNGGRNRVTVSGQRIDFIWGGCNRYSTNQDPSKEFLNLLCTALESFISNVDTDYSNEWPLVAHSQFDETGDREDTLFLLTNYGINSMDNIPSWLKYTSINDNHYLQLSYGGNCISINDRGTKGVDWKHFVKTFGDGVVKAVTTNKDKFHRIFEDHPVLGRYNFYVNRFTDYGTGRIAINTDIHPNNSKTAFTIGEGNVDHLVQFFKVINVFLENNK